MWLKRMQHAVVPQLAEGLRLERSYVEVRVLSAARNKKLTFIG